MTIVEQLENKQQELKERLAGHHSTWGSKSKEALEYKIKILDKLISIYQSLPPSIVWTEAEKILDQLVGFEKLKKPILTSLKTAEFRARQGLPKEPLIILVIGPVGSGKTASAQYLAQALKKKFASVALGGLTDPSLLAGASENSFGTEIGQLTRILVETETSAPLILLDEIDKAKPLVQDALLTLFDPSQNQNFLDHFLDVKLDFSQTIFVVTANNFNKVPDYLRSRSPLVINLTGYTLEQKRAIAPQFIEQFFANQEDLKNNFEISPSALETLISKTKEKGVRQLKQGFDQIFNYCLSQWMEQEREGEIKKIVITSSVVEQIIPENYFINIDQEDDQLNEREQIAKLQKELASLKKESKVSSQLKLKAAKFRSLSLIQQKLNNARIKKENLGEFGDYETKINQVNTLEEIEAIREETLLQIEYQNALLNPVNIPHKDKPKKPDNWSGIEKLIKLLGEKWDAEIKKIKQEIPEKSIWKIKNNAWFILFMVVVGLLIGAIYIIFKFKKVFIKSRPEQRKF